MHAETKMAQIRQNRQIPQADFASTNLTKKFTKIHEHSYGLTKFRQIIHFRY